MMKENKFHKLNMKKKEDSCQFANLFSSPFRGSVISVLYFIFHLFTYNINILQLVEEVKSRCLSLIFVFTYIVLSFIIFASYTVITVYYLSASLDYSDFIFTRRFCLRTFLYLISYYYLCFLVVYLISFHLFTTRGACTILVFIKSSLSLSCTYVRIIDALSINKDQSYTGLLAVWIYLLQQGTLK